MYMLCGYPLGIIVEAVLLAKGRNRLRVAVAGFSDVIELTRSGPQWFTATHQPVDFDFLMFNAPQGERVASSRPARVARAAGSAAIPH